MRWVVIYSVNEIKAGLAVDGCVLWRRKKSHNICGSVY